VPNVGIGTTSPQAALDVATTGTLASAIIVPRDSTTNRPSAPVNGMIRYNTTNTKLEAYENSTWNNIVTNVVQSATTSTISFSASNMVRTTVSGACGTLNIQNVAAGGTYTVTMPSVTSSCTTIQLNGSTTNVKSAAGYTGGSAVSGIVYSFVYDGTTLWMSPVGF
jgi:hypothetical protein